MGDGGLDAARALLPGERLTEVETLKSGDRSTVRRLSGEDDAGGQRSLVLKEYHDGGEGWLRESAALASVPGAVRVPDVIAAGADPQLLLLEDLGDGANLGDALDGDDPAAAAAGLLAWAEAMAELHSATRNSRDSFVEALAERHAAVLDHEDAEARSQVAESWMSPRLRDAERVLDRACGALGVRIPSGAMDELTGLITRLGGDGAAALTPADTCPENNVRIGDRLVLIDFEGAQWRHVAWDVAYLMVPWPSCPSAWRIPGDVAQRAVERYRERAAAAFPEVAADGFARDLDAAVAGWSLVTTAWSLDHALGSEVDLDQQLDPTRPTPTRRALIMHRLRLAAALDELPALAELADELWAVLQHRWGDTPLDLAPAFRRE